MACAAIGTDTGGSVRIPAALCGLTGFKTTAGRVPLDGCFPLSQTLDSAGPLGVTVTCCALLDQILRGVDVVVPEPLPIAGLRFAVPGALILEGAEPAVLRHFEGGLHRLSAAGAKITQIPLPELAESWQVSRHGGILGAEAWANHRSMLETQGERVDPRVRVRIERGAKLSAADYIDIVNARRDLIARANAATAPFDAVLMPTVACVAPRIDDVTESDEVYGQTNLFVLRNTTPVNFLDRCAITIPIHDRGGAPIGLPLMGETNGDDRLVRVALAVEALIGSNAVPG
jgi:aspartyl-tRNA(Asn)/glutamyl-tRNA(Gln) amidotransferase subunit A